MKKVLLGVMTAVTLIGGAANAHSVQNLDTGGAEYFKHSTVYEDSHGEYINVCSINTGILGCWKHEKHYLSYEQEASIPGDPAAAAGHK